jgi:monovalent cation/hydrogen antiporter
MANIATVIILLAVITALAELTDKIKVPQPILLVIAGMGIGFIPGLPVISIDPEIVLLVFLPPLLYAAAWTTSWPDFKKAKRPITLLAIGCVIFTTCAVAVIAHYFIPGLGWPESFVLGAIISPPDAVAATSATKGLALPRRVVTILEGESLVNDATGLIAYKYAVAAAVTGYFYFWKASLWFLLAAGGGIALGLLLGVIFKYIHKSTPNNPATDTTLTFMTPFIAYLSAEALHVSGVLAVVTSGLFLSWNSSVIFSQQTRLQANASWNTVIFILNGIIFILIGLQLPEIINNIEGHTLTEMLTYGAIVSAAVIIGRIIWVYPGAYVPRWMFRSIREREPENTFGLISIVAWSGMRGVVSLAAALSLPFVIDGGSPFPNRDLIIFITFSVIFATLVIQGLTLRPLIRLFKIVPDGKDHAIEQSARLALASSVIEHIEENYSMTLSDEVLNQIKTKYEIRIQRLRKDEIQRRLNDKEIIEFHRIQQELLEKERNQLIEMRNQGLITDEALRRIEYELDLEETRLILERGEIK